MMGGSGGGQNSARGGGGGGGGGTSQYLAPDFASDVGRKKFGFSREEIEDSSAYYEGQFKLYQRSGHGTLHSPDTGAKYVGQFQADNFHGEGVQIWSDGSRYKGQWKNGQKSGRGELTSADRLKYLGQWADGRRHGNGSQEYANGDRYEGWWYAGLCSGLGCYNFIDGSRYEGAWANGRYDGGGTLYGADGQRERQVYSNGVLMRRDVLPSTGQAPSMSGSSMQKAQMLGAKVLMSQKRDGMMKPTLLPKMLPSDHLIRRETDTWDLSAPPLQPKCAPAPLASAPPQDREDTRPPSPPAPC